MKKISDDDLTLLYYGEPEHPALAAAVAASPELSARYDALSAELDRVDELTPPQRGEDYGADVWQKISADLQKDQGLLPARLRNWMAAARQPRLSLAGAFSITLVAALAFMLGRQASPPVETLPPDTHAQPVTVLNETNPARLLTSSVSGHLEQLNIVFTRFAHAAETSTVDAEQATDMLVANRLYRQAAQSRGNLKLAALLSEIEPLLIELAYEAHKESPASRDRMQREVRDSLLYRVRIMNRQLNRQNIST